MQETRVQSLGWEDSPGERKGNPLQYSCLENPMDGGAWQATVHRVAKSWTRLSNYARMIMIVIVITIKHYRKIKLMKLQATRSYAANNTYPGRSASRVSPPLPPIMTGMA